MSYRPPLILVLPLGILFSGLWSSAFVAGKVALQYANPISLLVFRFAAAATIILCISSLTKRGRLLDNRVVGHGAVLGALNNALYLGLTFKGLEYANTLALTSLVVSTAPLLTLTFCNVILRERIDYRKISGVIIGFIGVYIALPPATGRTRLPLVWTPLRHPSHTRPCPTLKLSWPITARPTRGRR
jgi:probable blue pigment (indigoidine) exporter